MNDRICFKVNGVKQSAGCEVSSTTSLLQYLREVLELRGTKYMCLQGGCGACIVAVTKCPGGPVQSVNSCLVSITSCQDWEITTIEDVGGRLKGYHPLQKTLAESNGSQCGHCSPGWVMAMYSLLQKKELTMLEIEKSFGSNICRCTGYRPILEAFKKFAKDAPKSKDILDIEDLQLCKKTGEECNRDRCESDWCFVSKNDVGATVGIRLCDERQWYRVLGLKEIFNIMQNAGDSYMLVAGNTAKGVYPIDDYPKTLIDISGVPELKGYLIDQNLVVGAGNTLTELMEIFYKMSDTEYFKYLKIFNDHLEEVAHIPVRNIGTIGGNLMIKHQHPEFPSDIYLLLQTVGSQITIMHPSGKKKTVTMEEFLGYNMKRRIILNIMLPPLCRACKVVTYKVKPRAQNVQAIVNAGFFYRLTKDNRVNSCIITFGGLSPSFSRSLNTEKHLVGKRLFTNETLQSAIKIMENELVVTEDPVRFSVEYRRRLAIGLFYKGLLSLCPESTIDPRYRSGAVKLSDTRPVSQGHQEFETDSSLWPLNEPIQNIDGLIQCAGEALYTDDMPSVPHETFAALVMSTVPLGDIKEIDIRKAMKYPGVLAFYSAKDIPGVNTFTRDDIIPYSRKEEVFCSGQVKYYNQAIGVIVAETQHAANVAAKLVTAKYVNVKKPTLDIKIAKKDPTKVTLFMGFKADEKGNDTIKVIKGNQTIYSQYHFPLETIACISYPSEKGMMVYPTTQWMDLAQELTSQLLKIDQNSIDVHIRRLGGAFGIKISRSNMVAMACNLIVHKLKRPCRFIQTLENNMRILGKRFPASADFEFGVDSKGVIQYMNYDLYEDNGYIVDELLILLGMEAYSNCYDKKRWNYNAYDAVTDTPSNTFFRAPGTLENIAMAEMMMERIACEMSIDPLDVRLANLDAEYYSDFKGMLDMLSEKARYTERKAAVNKFNAQNRWTKRGLRYSFMRFPSSMSVYLNITLSVYHGDGSVAIVHAGVEMGQGVNTKAVQVCAHFLQIPVDKIKIKPNNTIIAPNCFLTGNSITSQNVALGVQRCCEELLKRLEPIRSQMGNPKWEDLIKKAYEAEINLQTQAITNKSDENVYNVYGVALCEVEIDVLTGEREVIRVDLCEDVGRSVSPLIDIGQIEGAFVMGLGYWTTERLVADQNTGELLTDRSWNYWVPQARDIPQNLNIYFKKRSYSNDVILGSKATGEPATCLGIVVPIAMREAITSARVDSGLSASNWFQIDGPYTVEQACLTCETKYQDFKFY